MKIPLYTSNTLTRSAVHLALEEMSVCKEALPSGVSSILEENLCCVTGASYASVTANRGDAIRNLLYAWSVCGTEAVFVPSFADSAILFAVMECGAVPIFVDCDRDTWHMSAEKLESAVEKCIKQNELYPRAVIVSDIFGMPFEPTKINSVCAKYGLLLIEDASFALGAKAGEKCVGTLSDAAIVSVGYTAGVSKCGAVLTDDVRLSRSVKLALDGGRKVSDSTTGALEIVGRSSRSHVDQLTAALMLAELRETDRKTARRREIAKKLRSAAEGTAIKPQAESEKCMGAYPVFAVCAQDKESAERMVRALRDEGIECRMMYSKPLCRNSAFKELGWQASDVPVGSNLSVCTFLLPCHEELTEEQTDYICEKIKVICV